jgi:hypothetical protein
VAANGGSTTIPVVFKPTVAGQRVATLLLTDNASGSPQSVALSGNGTSSQPPGINVTPANIVFANETVGTTSAASPVTVTNTTTTAAQITALTFSGPNVSDFSTPATTPIPVAANGGTATIAVTFTPSAAGTRTATLTVADNSGGSPHTVFLSGTGTAAGPGISVSPTSLNFGNQALNVTATLPVTVSNTGGTTANVTGMLLAGLNASSFNVLGSRSFPLTAGSSATITVQFTPPTLGSLTATLLINNDVGSALVVQLSGTGVTAAPAIVLIPTSLTFANQAIGTTSAPLSTTATNTGNTALQITALGFGGSNPGDFGWPATFTPPTPATPITVAANGSTTIPVVFKPTIPGQRVATLLITDNAIGSPQSVAVGGTGTGPVVGLSPTSLPFGNQNLGTTSSPSSIAVTNTGNAALQITALAFGGTNPGDFAFPASFTRPTPSSPITVAANGGAITIPVVFQPALSGQRAATLQLTDNASPSTQSVALAGNGVGSTVTSSAAFVKTDTTTQGNWKSSYGADGYNVIGDTTAYPSYATVTPSGQSSYVWASSTSDVRALEKAASSDRIAGTWYSGSSFTVDVNLTDGKTHQLALYCLDWDNGARAETISISDATTGTVLDSRSVSSFVNGEYLIWNISGHIAITVTLTGGSNAVVSGIFFGGPHVTSSAAFVKTDTTTQGNWKSSYGADGYNVIGDTTAYPSYATVTPSGQSSYVWASSTSDVRALEKAASSDRIAGTWYSGSSFTVDVNLTDGKTHQLALYCLDWDNGARAETISISDATTGTVLDSRSVSSFVNGEYLIWNISGHIAITVTLSGGSNAVVSGIFFGSGVATSPTATLSTTSLTFGSQPVNTSSSPLTITITNSGQTDLSVSSVSLSGINASDFQVSPTGPFTVTKNGGSAVLSITFTPSAVSTRTATLSIYDTASNSPQTVSLSGTGTAEGQITLNSLSLGENLETLAIGSLTVAPTTDLQVTIASSDGSKVLVEPWATDRSGTSAGVVSFQGTIAKGTTLTPGFWVQALASSGTPKITITVNNANNYAPGSATVNLTPSGFVLNNPNGTPGANFTTLLGGNPAPLTVSPVQLDSSNNVCTSANPACGFTSQVLRGGLVANVNVSSASTGIGVVANNPAVVQPGSGTSSAVTFQPLATGQSQLSIPPPQQPSGFSPPNSETSLMATVMAPSITGAPVTVGFNMQVGGTFQLNQPPSGSIMVTITSPDATKVLLSNDLTVPGTNVGGTSTIDVQVDSGATSTHPFYIQAVDSSGGVTLTAHATAGGYTDGTAPVALAPSAFLLSGNDASGKPLGFGMNFPTTTLALPTGLTVAIYQLNSMTLQPAPSVGQLRPGISPLPVAVTSSNTGAGTIIGGSPAGTATFNAGDSTNASLSFQPASNCNAPCQTVLSVTQPPRFITPQPSNQGNQWASLTVTVTQPAITLNVPASIIGRNLEVPGRGALTAPASNYNNSGGLPVTITSDNPNVLLSPLPTTAGSQEITLIVPAGGGVSTFPNYYVQALASSGQAHLTASAPNDSGFVSGPAATVNLAPSGFVISAPGASKPGGTYGVLLSSGSVPLTLQACVLDATGMPLSGGYQMVSGGLAPSITVTSDSGAAVVMGSPVLMAGGGTLPDGTTPGATVTLQLQSTGVANIAVTTPSAPPGFTTPSLGNQLQVTIN